MYASLSPQIRKNKQSGSVRCITKYGWEQFSCRHKISDAAWLREGYWLEQKNREAQMRSPITEQDSPRLLSF